MPGHKSDAESAMSEDLEQRRQLWPLPPLLHNEEKGLETMTEQLLKGWHSTQTACLSWYKALRYGSMSVTGL